MNFDKIQEMFFHQFETATGISQYPNDIDPICPLMDKSEEYVILDVLNVDNWRPLPDIKNPNKQAVKNVEYDIGNVHVLLEY